MEGCTKLANKMETKAQQFIAKEFKRRTDLINDENFRIKCIEVAKQMGITAKEWNESKGVIILHLANEVCGLENKLHR
jgi:hypothetical protein